MAIRKSSTSGIPSGNIAGRPANPGSGQLYSNGETARLELYTANGWQNIVQETPGVAGVTGTYNESAGSGTFAISGTNFVDGGVAYAVGTNAVEYQATSSTYNSIVQMTAVFTGLSAAHEPYDLKVVNPSNLFGILPDAFFINQTPLWSTQSGVLGSFVEQSSVSSSVSASDPEGSTVTYSSSNLPVWLSLNSSTGALTGTAPQVNGNTSFPFDIVASDGINTSSRLFSISITEKAPLWSTTSPLPTFTRNSAYSTTVVAVDESGNNPSYSIQSGSLPTGLSLSSSGVISGTPTSSTDVVFTIRATDVSGSFSDRQFAMPNSNPIWTTSEGSITGAFVGSAYSFQLVAQDDSGNNPSYSLISGSITPGISLSSSGLISGNATSAGSFNFTIRATDANGGFQDRAFSLLSSVQPGSQIFGSVGTFNFTVPAAVTSISVLGIGGGGAGSASNGNNYGGGGGGSGYLSIDTLSVTPGEVLVVSPGAAGPAPSGRSDNSNSEGDGPNGSSSTVSRSSNVIFTALGGNGGRKGVTSGSTAGFSNGGAGGNGGGAGDGYGGQGFGGSGGTNGSNGGNGTGNDAGASSLGGSGSGNTNITGPGGLGGQSYGAGGGGGGGFIGITGWTIPSYPSQLSLSSDSSSTSFSGVGYGAGGAARGHTAGQGGPGINGMVYIKWG
jgi:large repetitive protein